ncbi:hypothetical protein ES705_08399 [subsurface metagenome]
MTGVLYVEASENTRLGPLSAPFTWGATTDTVGRRIWWSADAANITFTIDAIHTARHYLKLEGRGLEWQ